MFEAAFVKVLKNIFQEKSSTTVCIFDKGDYYVCYDKQAGFLAKQIFKSVTVIKYLGVEGEPSDYKLQYVNINKNQFEKVIKELLLFHQYRVEVYRCVNSKNHEWELHLEASPGNLSSFEDILTDTGNMIESTTVVALKITNSNEKISIAVACCDISNQTFTLAEFPDGPRLSCLESLLVQIGPKECLFSTNDKKNVDFKVLESVVRRVNAVLTERKPNEFKTDDIVKNLNRLLKFRKGEQPNSAGLPQMELKNANDCLSALIKYLNLLEDNTNSSKYRLETFVFDQYVRLDVAAVKSLELFDSSYANASDKNTLFGLLNNCQTSAGKRLLDEWIKMPLIDLNKINERLDAVEVFVDDNDVRRTLRNESLNKIDDLPKLMRSFTKKRATLNDVFKVYQTIRQIPQLMKILSQIENHKIVIGSMFIQPFDDIFNDFKKYIELFESTVEVIAKRNSFDIRIKADFDENLQQLGEELKTVDSSINKELNRVGKDLNLEPDKSLKLETSNQLGYFFRISRKEEKLLRDNRNYQILEAQKAGVRFTSSKLRSLNEEYSNLNKQYEKTQENIAEEVIKIASGYLDPMQRLSRTLAILDVILSFAETATTSKIPYVRPKMFEKGRGVLSLKDARHPCLEFQDDVSFISNDIDLEKDNSEFLIITGPNMGGKSTFLRQTAIIVLMAQIGCFVPCSSAKISVVDAIFTRVGASDCQLKGVSTFMAEMLETASILEAATKNSLVIIDELGRGTSTYDGFGLAYAIAEHIASNIRAFTLFATHFHELTSLSQRIPTVHNFHVSANVVDNQVTLLYKVHPGVCDESFGIHIAEMVHFPKHIVDNAWEKVSLYSRKDDGSFVQLKDILDDTSKNVEEKAKFARSILKEYFDK